MNERAIDHKCPNCGSILKYYPKSSNWKCENCKSEFTLKDLKKFNNASSDENNDSTKESVEYVTYRCKDCGAEIVCDDQTAATFCVYCGNTAILKNKLTGKFAPSMIIPFKKEKEDAINAFKSLYKGRPLMPKFFNDEKNIKKITGVYIPFWLFDLDVEGKIEANAENVTTWTVGDTQFVKTDKYLLVRDGSMTFNKVPADGSTRFPNDIMNSIEPFNYDGLLEYNHAYLSGFYAERYDEESDKLFDEVKKRALTTATNEMVSDMGSFTSKTVTSNNLNVKKSETSYVLLPVWMLNVKYNDKMYTFAMNAQTGKFVGNIPVDKKKAIIYGIGIFVITFLISLLVSYLIFTGGN